MKHKLTENLPTHIYAKDFVDTVHVRKTTDNFPYDSVEARAETTTRNNACPHILRFKIHLNIVSLETPESNQNCSQLLINKYISR